MTSRYSPAMPRRTVVGVMGAAKGATVEEIELAERLGELVAREGFVLLTGGRPVGVMAAANRGAKRVAGSITLGVSPLRGDQGDEGEDAHVDVCVFTGMGDGRNVVNVLSSDVVVTCGKGGPGTASEAALALKSDKPLVMLAASREAKAFFSTLGTVHFAETAEEALEIIRRLS